MPLDFCVEQTKLVTTYLTLILICLLPNWSESLWKISLHVISCQKVGVRWNVASSPLLSAPCRSRCHLCTLLLVSCTLQYFHHSKPTLGLLLPNSASRLNDILMFQHTGKEPLQPKRELLLPSRSSDSSLTSSKTILFCLSQSALTIHALSWLPLPVD